MTVGLDRGSFTGVLTVGSAREGCASGAFGREVLEFELGVGVRKREGDERGLTQTRKVQDNASLPQDTR